MLTLNGLSGRELSKALIRDKQLRSEYKALMADLTAALINDLEAYSTCKLENDTATTYIVSPSTYTPGALQLTTFIRDLPHCHNTYENAAALLKDNVGLIIQAYKVKEGVTI